MPIEFVGKHHDPVWGTIPVTRIEAKLLTTFDLARLGHIKQLGLAFLDFPTLTHTRLEHSLGVMHVADHLYRSLSVGSMLMDEQRAALFDLAGTGHVHQCVRLAALLHDLGHPPFSHAVESAFKRFPAILAKAKAHLPSGRAYEGLDEVLERYSHEAFTAWQIERLLSLPEIASELKGLPEEMVKATAELAIGESTHPLLAPFNRIISGDFDADRIDYLIRDNLHSGFTLGLSLDDLLGTMHLRVPLGGAATESGFELYVDASALPFINTVLLARERLTRRVHLARAGRTATQMLVAALVTHLETVPEEALAVVICDLHTKCTDVTFVRDLAKAASGITSVTSIKQRFLSDFLELAHSPVSTHVWEEWFHLDFMRMHPCLRLLAHIAGSSGWEGPNDLLFVQDDEIFFLEPIAKTAQWSDLLVDYDRAEDGADYLSALAVSSMGNRPQPASLDFLGTSENRVGRAIVVQTMSNVDAYVYRLKAPSADRDTLASRRVETLLVNQESIPSGEYPVVSDEKGERVVRWLSMLGRRGRDSWRNEGRGMNATEFVLLVLYALDKDVRDRWESTHTSYVYRSEFFVNRFIPSLGDDESLDPIFPSIFRGATPGARGDAKRVFTQIQRLAAFGLVTIRSMSSYNSERGRDTGATRTGVYSSREELSINNWGRVYVENEIRGPDRAFYDSVIERVHARQEAQVAKLEEMARAHWAGRWNGERSAHSVSELHEFDAKRVSQAQEIHRLGACAMTMIGVTF